MFDGNAIWTYFRWFLCCLQLGLFAAEDVDAKNAYVGDTCASNTCARGTYAGNAFSAVDTYIKGADPESTGTEGADTESAYTGGIGAVEYSIIHL